MNITPLDNILNNIFSTYDFFLFEVFAIPEEVRWDYLNKLLTRKGGAKQKNVRFLRHLYKVLEENKLNLWDEKLICHELKISPRMLDCYKSRILKSLREMYFDQNKHLQTFGEDIPDGPKRNLAIAENMFRIGMVKEAKQIYLKLEGDIGKIKPSEQKEYREILSAIYEAMVTYYSFQRDLRKFNLYLSKAESNLKKALKYLREDQTFNIKLRVLKIRFRKLSLKTISSKNIQSQLDLLKEILRLAEKTKVLKDVFFAYEHLGILSGKLKDFENEEKYFLEGLNLAKKKGFSENEMIFDTLISFTTFRKNNKNARSYLKKTEKYYNLIKSNYYDFGNLLTVHRNYLRMLIYFNKPGCDDEVEQYIKHLILFSQKTDAISNWYLELSDRLTSGICKWEVYMTGPDNYELNVSVDKKLHKYFEEMNYNTLIHFKGLYSPEALAVMYLNQIDLEFWKGTRCNFENSNYFINKLQRLVKTRHVGTNLSWLDSSKIGVNIFEEMKFKNKKAIFDKYYPEISKFIDSIKDEKKIFNIVDDFAKLIFISKVLNTPGMKKELRNLESWIKENRPELIKSIFEAAIVKTREFRVA